MFRNVFYRTCWPAKVSMLIMGAVFLVSLAFALVLGPSFLYARAP